MTKINLSPEELTIIQQCINDNVEIPLDVMQKLNPSFFDKLAQDSRFNFEKLNRYKIPTIEYAGKRSESTILASATLLGQSSPLQVERLFEGGKMKTDGELQMELYSDNNKDGNMDVEDKDKWMNMIVQGDNLQFLKTCYLNQDPLIKDKVRGKVKLVYIDPPFGTGDEYGAKEGEMSYSAKLAGSEFVESLRERLIYLRELLKDDGCIFVRLDYHFGHYIRVVLDEVFGKENFINEIIINRGKQRLGGKNKYSTATDTLYFYAKTKNKFSLNQFKRERYSDEASGTNMLMKGWRNPPQREFIDPEGKRVTLYPPQNQHWKFVQEKIDVLYEKGVMYLAKSKKGLESGITKKVGDEFIKVDYVPSFKFDDDKTIDSNWTDISGYDQTTNYPTENSESLLERVVFSATNTGDIVLDCFGGSGTTASVSEKLGRKWIMCDFGKHAIYTMQKRLLTIGNSKKLGITAKSNEMYGQSAKPFSIVSVGAFDFSKILDLRKHQTAYIDFVLELNGIHERDTSKYSIPNIYGTKEGNPVEVYPIWDDEYLKNIKIDNDYLKGIIQSTGGKLKGDYYIIAPEICDIIGDTQLSNQNGGTVNFKLLTFPYKILEEVSRHYQLSEQPSDGGDINNLISSTRFYFNEEVKFKAELVKDGLIIKEFETNITDKDGNKFNNLDGLAMVLIDKDWDGNLFTMEESVYLKDIPHDPEKPDYGHIKVSGLSDKIALIVVDKHGNESNITIIEKQNVKKNQKN